MVEFSSIRVKNFGKVQGLKCCSSTLTLDIRGLSFPVIYFPRYKFWCVQNFLGLDFFQVSNFQGLGILGIIFSFFFKKVKIHFPELLFHNLAQIRV